jgi:hypothetical protein
MGLGVAAVFGCVACGAVVVAMSAIDLYRHAREGNSPAMVFDALDIVTFGVGTKVELGVKAAKEGVQAARVVQAGARSSAKAKRAANLVHDAEMRLADAKSLNGVMKNGHKAIYGIGTLVTGAELIDDQIDEE